MVEATNFVEKTLGVSLDKGRKIDPETNPTTSEGNEQVPTYTPPLSKHPIPEFTPPQINQQPVIQIIEKIVYKKQRIHGFFRTLTIIALLAI